ncbi:signal transduction histidine kinase [Maritimibacter alkaliphilus HTCC2654]|uniref:histidine kinase n=1 Tax=Maritimibacter alkaliphilus HTCC2654 TaxID=314271 RepID=A3VII1_9RHOB|nr:ATP-binding protein [Maritimibacter alkaliphilus]EAQ11912.1 two-component hybrid sensor and regulator [Rhodobacterales bacterium HTCC2654] [Maritimibacter alkaliphilus HTCC2654]TYP85667.1 signal transduction histidine kinase [Maritimibacter alkaliphilus HTCC2654]
MSLIRPSLRNGAVAMVFAAFAIGLVAAWMWSTSNRNWTGYLDRARVTGVLLYDTLTDGLPPPNGLSLERLAPDDAARADAGDFSALSFAPRPTRVSLASILPDTTEDAGRAGLSLAVLSRDVRYQVSDITKSEGQRSAETLGLLVRLVARYCSDAVILARAGAGPWVAVSGDGLWTCDAAPTDLRLPAVFLSVVTLAILFTVSVNTAGQFTAFADLLKGRRRIGERDLYEIEGPQELREIVTSVNAYLDAERKQLENRAVVLSGVSHDLGSPATRLRLRAALIEDEALRGKFETDIDRMTGMIESVLTYTRAEMDAEDARQLSLLSLVEATVADFQDVGHPVTFEMEEPTAAATRSLFTGKQGRGALTERQRVLVTGRPIALARALSNLIDNALKYGRRAHVSLAVASDRVVLTVEDEGSDMSVPDVEAAVAPFKRGTNTETISGFGMGLTIVATVAEQHGGRLFFERGDRGLRARLEILRA